MQYISTSARQIAENDTQYEISYGPPEDDFSIPPPDNQLVKSIFPGDKFHFSPTRPYYVSILDGFILNPEGAVLTDTSTPLNESMNGIINRYTQSSIHSIVNHIKSKRSDSVRYIDNTVMPLHNVFQAYYHTLVEDIPKLRYYHTHRKKTDRSPIIIVPSDVRDYKIELLELFDIDSSCIYYQSAEELRCKEILLPIHRPHIYNSSKFYHSFRPSTADLKWMSSFLNRQEVTETQSSLQRRIYVSREGSQRAISNQSQMKSILEGFQFEIYHPEDHPVNQQVDTFSQAEIIVGPHGSGLTNMIFSQSPQIIEIFPSDYIRPFYYVLSQQLGYNYQSLVGEERNENNRFRVDTEQLRSVLPLN